MYQIAIKHPPQSHNRSSRLGTRESWVPLYSFENYPFAVYEFNLSSGPRDQNTFAQRTQLYLFCYCVSTRRPDIANTLTNDGCNISVVFALFRFYALFYRQTNERDTYATVHHYNIILRYSYVFLEQINKYTRLCIREISRFFYAPKALYSSRELCTSRVYFTSTFFLFSSVRYPCTH